ncbi:SH3 domain-containing protein [Sphingomonas sp.]|uniref:SH3 domain-containing protein n=1 Tax=Sphingomonas sp. TaxID=28214 RepID=UPI0035BC04CF
MRTIILAVTALALMLPTAAPAADAKRKVPYLASIQASRARMRTGPGRTYPASWLYQRSGLPVRVIAVLKEWRKVEDPDGTTGWMQGNLLSDVRTAIVRGTQPIEMRERPSVAGKLMWRAAPGVVGRVSACADGWCRFDVMGQAAYVETGGLWGVEAGEVLP